MKYEIACTVDGCSNSFVTSEPLASGAKYTCRVHSGPDTKNDIVFQSASFEKELGYAHLPQGTRHIRNQGSRITNADDLPSSMWRKTED